MGTKNKDGEFEFSSVPIPALFKILALLQPILRLDAGEYCVLMDGKAEWPSLIGSRTIESTAFRHSFWLSNQCLMTTRSYGFSVPLLVRVPAVSVPRFFVNVVPVPMVSTLLTVKLKPAISTAPLVIVIFCVAWFQETAERNVTVPDGLSTVTVPDGIAVVVVFIV